MITIEDISTSRRYPLRFKVNDRICVAFTHHATKRCAERKIDPKLLLQRVEGCTLRQWRHRGVVAKWTRQKDAVVVITAWTPLWLREE